MPGGIAAALASMNTPLPPQNNNGGDSFFGIHLPNLGLDQLPGMVGGAVSGLWNLGPGAAINTLTGHGDRAVNAWEGMGKGVLSGLYNTEAHIGGALSHLPVVGAPIGKFFNDTTNQWGNYLAQTSGAKDDATKQAIYNQEVAAASPSAYQHAFIPTLINDVGSASIAGGVAEKALGLGEVGAAAKAATAAESAARAGYTADELANAGKAAEAASPLARATSSIPIVRRFTSGDLASMPAELRDAAVKAVRAPEGLDEATVANRANMLRMAEATASPVKSLMRGVISPLGRAATDANIADVAEHTGAHPVEGAATEAASTAENAPRIGPKQRAFEYRNAQPVPQWAQDAMKKVPAPVRDALQTIEGMAQSRGMKAVGKEQRRFVESARRAVLYGPEMKGAVDAATELVGQRSSELGRGIRPNEASGMVGEEIISRLTGRKQIAETLKARFPEHAAIIDKAFGTGTMGVPHELMTPELDAKVNEAVDQFNTLAEQRRATMEASRKGTQGLEASGDRVVPTTAQEREAAAIQRETDRAIQLTPRRHAELDRVRTDVAGVSTKISRAAEEFDRIQQAIKDNRLRAATDIAERPDLFDASKGINYLGDKSVADIARQLKQRQNETPAALKARAVRVGRAIERDRNLQERAARLQRQGKQLDRAQADLYDTLRNERTPTAIRQEKALNALRTRQGRLAGSLEHPTIAQTPGPWKPLMGSFKELRSELGKTPGGAEALAAMPEKFSEVVARARELGADPTHVASLSEDSVRRLINDPVQLFSKNRSFETITSGQRKVRRGAQARTQTLEALAAAQVDVVHEAASNEVVSMMERSVARPVLHDDMGNVVIPHGFHAWDGESGVKSFITGKETEHGQVVEAGQLQPTKMIPDNVYRAISNMSGNFQHSMWTNIGKITNPWRALVLTYSPGWYMKHFIGHAVLATAQGVRLADWAAAWEAYRAQQGATHNAFDTMLEHVTSRGGYHAADVAPEGIKGVGGTSLYSDLTGEQSLVHGPNSIRDQAKLAGATVDEGAGKVATKRAAARAVFNQVQRRMQRVNEVGDNIGRAAMYLSQRRAGMSPEFALQKAATALIDYNDLSPFERSVVRSFVPFYAFQKGMFQIMARLPIDHPAAAMAAMQLARLNNDMNGGLPSYYSGMIHVPGTSLNVNTRSFNPFADATSLATPQGIAQGMNPFIEIAARNALGAPVNPASKRYRIDEFGHAVPDTAPAAELAGVFTGVPIATSATGLAGAGVNAKKGKVENALKLGGVSTYSPAEVQAMIQRQQKAQLVTQTGNPYVKLPGSTTTPTKYTGPGATLVNAQQAAASGKTSKRSVVRRKIGRRKVSLGRHHRGGRPHLGRPHIGKAHSAGAHSRFRLPRR